MTSKAHRALTRLADQIKPMRKSCTCEIRTEPTLQLRVHAGQLKLSISEDERGSDRYVLIRIAPDGDFLADWLQPIEVLRKVAALLQP